MTTTLYTNQGCMPCKAVKRWLTDHKIPFESKDAGSYVEEVVALGIRTVPALVCSSGNMILGFNEQELKEEFLK